jgi:aspartyl-tRNA(Asn)/glutamyl-tRNA(Gln) amidotransferase subunit B
MRRWREEQMVNESKGNWEAVIGLELHAQLRTESKQYCACPVMFTNDPADANRYVCPICLGHPGVLPMLNRKSVGLALRLAIAAGATVNRRNVFARKNYFYPDLPKGYQISQYEAPLAEGGELPYYTAQARAESARGGGAMIADADARMARFTRMHLEEDTAKSYHLPDGRSIVDFNRSGIPLIEIVTQPDFRNADDAIAYLEEIRLTMIYLGVSDANMELGQMRCEPNVSVRRVGEAELRTKTEIKNLNSFALLKKAVEYEIERQTHEWESGGRVLPQTMRWDDDASGFDGRTGATVAMRTKETADDYRYFDEPDLPPLIVTDAMLADAARFSYLTAFMLRRRLMEEDGLSEYDARNIAAIPSNFDWYDALIPVVLDA